ncbi:MAG TPA: hypothetical protein VHV78_12060 [Gemmatimonadaceae bacterium]|jgi:hypothetical protein|nr:hypothetical protein [Gemmatimonadaceae bacterium]
MNERTFGRTGWFVGEIGCGMWRLAGWTGSDDTESMEPMESLQLAVDLGWRSSTLRWRTALKAQLRPHRWDREPTERSQ